MRTLMPCSSTRIISTDSAISSGVGGSLVYIECGNFDKYGRLLVTMYAEDGENINEWMIKKGYGVPYEGGRKIPWGEPAASL